jgi:putative membrane protein
MALPRSFKDHMFLFLKGLGMGAANKVPGVSGGIVAFVGGFYEEFIYALKKVNKKAFFLLISGRFKSLYKYINGPFLSVLLFGMLVSYFSVSKICMGWLFWNDPWLYLLYIQTI